MVEPQIVVLDVAGSSPVDHPIFPVVSELPAGCLPLPRILSMNPDSLCLLEP